MWGAFPAHAQSLNDVPGMMAEPAPSDEEVVDEELVQDPKKIDKKTVPTPPPEETEKHYNAIRLQGLNKVSARISVVEGTIGTVMRFGNLEIVAHRCWQAPPEDEPESAGLLEVWELKPGEGRQKVFSGWMFASSPGLSSLEHPVYDITVLSCTALKAGGDQHR